MTSNFIINWKFVGRFIGSILWIESLLLFGMAVFAYLKDGVDMWAFVWSGGIAFAVGSLLILLVGLRSKILLIGKKESYLTVALTWIVFAIFGAFPFLISGATSNFADAFFEATSGITTTGASVLSSLDTMPHALLLWRSILQWLGGLGIIVFSIVLLPLMGSAAQLFDAETTGLTHDKFRPRVTQMATRILAMYIIFTMIVIALLGFVSPMAWFDAVCHGFSTISTGGFSTKTESIAYWNSMTVEAIVALFMIIGAINFPLMYMLFAKGEVKRFWKDEELRWFLAIILISTALIAFGLYYEHSCDAISAVRRALFQVVAVISTTGFCTADFSIWGSHYLILFLLLMVVCGCAGSTSGGLKVVRAVVLTKNTFQELQRLVHPRAIIPVRLNGNAVSFVVVQRLLAFAFLYIAIIYISWGILTIVGIPFEDALGAAVTAIGNIGPGFGALGPKGSFIDIPTFAKYYLAFLMVVGRLEVFTVLMLFTPGFWKR